jgi:acyl-[acyl carrier protein]--UDP-N-acetylglucosamine O-acyltransferase
MIVKRKYEFTGEIKNFRRLQYYKKTSVLHQIVATEDIPQHNVKKGDIGGWIEKYDNLKDNAWVGDNAMVLDNACVYDNARVIQKAYVSGNAQVYGNARVYGNAEVGEDARVYGDVYVYDNALIGTTAEIFGDVHIGGYAHIFANAQVFGDERICGTLYIMDDVEFDKHAFIKTKDDYCYFSGFGSENRSTTAYKTKDGSVRIVCGCFNGTIDEFEKRIKNTYDEQIKYYEEYLTILKLIKIKLSN